MGAGAISRRGFTLLEVCIVLFIIAILLGAMMPSIQSAFAENALRADARQLSLLVKTGMLHSNDQGQDYVLDLTAASMDLHPAGVVRKEDDAPETDKDETSDSSLAADQVLEPYHLDSANKLLIPDPKKASAWMAMPATSWLFRPGELCPATRVRLLRGKAWVEVSFNALTGNVENETAYIP